MNSSAKILYKEAQSIANDIPEFLNPNGPGKGNIITNNFMKTLKQRMSVLLNDDFSEKKICDGNEFAVDYYFPSESTIVEIALSIKKPNSEYEKDILKAVIAKENGLSVKRLIFISKEGAKKKCNQPARKRIKEWLNKNYDIQLEVWEFSAT